MKGIVFVDVICSTLLDEIRLCSSNCFEEVEHVNCTNTCFIAAWNARQTPNDDRFVCYVSETKTLQDADMSFAVFCTQVPSLSLSACKTMTPLMHSAADTGASRAIREFFSFPEKQGSVVVIEGGDGAGKQTQTKLLVDRLSADGCIVQSLDFPHDSALCGSLVRVILSGKKGGISELDPRLFSFLYSLNRYGCLPKLKYWVRRGHVVVLDRYYTANFGHQASKLPVNKRKPFIAHLEHSEVDWLGLPVANRVIYLDLPSKVALEAMQQDTRRVSLDIHETAGGSYKEAVRQTYLWCCAELKGWHLVRSCEVDGVRKSREVVHKEIYSVVGA